MNGLSSSLPSSDRHVGAAATVEPRLLQGVLEDLERHIALREAFRKLMGAKRGK